ncbi:unnamed protein product [Camellia sinensis]
MQQAWVHIQTGLTGLHLYCGGSYSMVEQSSRLEVIVLDVPVGHYGSFQ